ncbi:Serine/threonine-protein kinase StkP [Planctomycetes bacterium Pan216]|uniref:Serine/threonine-protein kinase StkP n=1 Tax=Kolteria novifilia TaxID=2527975 RepID=A0A518AZ04_9BACT|nr:Serine/threonine-protein kinase StkP [Planctomycetes bacterium Pan216]
MPNCPDQDRIISYLHGRLSVAELSEIENHLDSCELCQTLLGEVDDPNDSILVALRSSAVADEYAGEESYRTGLERAERIGQDWSQDEKPNEDRPREPDRDELGSIREYRLLERLGEGAMGQVYRARHERLDKLVALKILRHSTLSNPAAVARFGREMRAVGKLDHPNIVRATDAGEFEGVHYLVMELVDGLDLSNLCRRVGLLGTPEACEIIRQAANGLQHAHEHGLIHRDIKPPNLILTTQGVVKILDLGLARPSDDEKVDGELTAAGQVVGTVNYLAPEQAGFCQHIGARADIYSLGCTLFRLLSGRAPYDDGQLVTPYQYILAHVKDPIPRITEKRRDVPRKLEAILIQMMAKDPKDRIEEASQVAELLTPYCAKADLSGLFNSTDSTVVESTSSPTVDLPKAETKTEGYDWTCIERVSSGGPPRVRRRRAFLTGGLAFLVTLAGMITYLTTGEGKVELTVNEPGYTVALDGKEITLKDPEGETTVLSVPAGRHELLVRKSGFESVSRVVRLMRHGRVAVEAKLVPKEAPTVAKVDEPPPKMADDPSPRAVTPLTTTPKLAGTLATASLATSSMLPTEATIPRLSGLVAEPKELEGIHRWQVDTVKPRSDVNAVAYSPDGKSVAVATHGSGHLRIYDAHTNRLLHVLPTQLGGILALAWSPDGETIVCSHTSRNLYLWKPSENRLLRRWRVSPMPVRAMAFSTDGRHLAVAHDRRVELWNAAGERQSIVGWHDDQVTSLAWDPKSERLLSGGKDNSARIWTLDGSLEQTLSCDAPVLSVGWDPKGEWISTAEEKHFLLWKSDGTLDRELKVGDNSFKSHSWAPDGDRLAIVTYYGVHLRNREFKPTLVSANNFAQSLAWSPDGQTFVIGSDLMTQSGITFFDRDGKRLSELSNCRQIRDMASHPDGTKFAVGTRQTAIWSSDGRDVTVVRANSEVPECAWSPTGDVLAVGKSYGETILASSGGKILRTLKSDEPSIDALAWSPDGKWLATASSLGNGAIRIWNVDGTAGPVLKGHEGGVPGLSWNPSNQLVSSGRDGTVRFWNVPTFNKHEPARESTIELGQPAWRLQWAPDTMRIVVDGNDGRAIVLDEHGIRLPKSASLHALISGNGDWCIDPSGEWCATARSFMLKLFSLDGKRTWRPLLGRLDIPVHVAWLGESRLAIGGGRGIIVIIDTVTGELQWTGITLRNGDENVSFTPEGEVLFGKPHVLEDELVYIVEPEPGRYEMLSPSEFKMRMVTPTKSLAKRVPKVVDHPRRGWKNGPIPPDTGIVPRPASLPGVASWQMNTIGPLQVLSTIAISPDGKSVVVGSRGGSVRLYDARTMELRQLLRGHAKHGIGKAVKSLKWSTDGDWIASVGDDGRVRLSTADGRRGPVLHHPYPVTDVAWSSDGNQLATASRDDVTIWNRNGDRVRKLGGFDGHVNKVDWSSAGWLAAGSLGPNPIVRLWKPDGTPGSTLEDFKGSVLAVAWTPDGEYLAAIDQSQTVRVWSRDGELTHSFETDLVPHQSLKWDPSGKVLSVGSWSKLGFFSADGTPIAVANVVRGTVYDLVWEPRGQRFYLAGGDAGLVLGRLDESSVLLARILFDPDGGDHPQVDWRPGTDQLSWNSAAHYPAPYSLPMRLATADGDFVTTSRHCRRVSNAWNRLGDRLVGWTSKRGISLLSPDGRFERYLQRTPTSAAWSPDGSRVAVGLSYSGKLQQWSADGELLSEFKVDEKGITENALAWNAKGDRLATSGKADAPVKIWRPDGTLVRALDVGAAAIAWNPQPNLLATTSRYLKVFDAEGKPDSKFKEHSAECLAWSPDGGQLAVGGELGDIYRESVNGASIPSINAHSSKVESLAWSDDGKRLASSGADGLVKVWDTETREPLWAAVNLPYAKTVTFTGAGEILFGDPAVIDEQLRYVLETADGARTLLTPKEFEAFVDSGLEFPKWLAVRDAD